MYVAEGIFDIGITGRDWVEETASDVLTLGELRYSKATARPIRRVVAVPQDSPFERVEDLPQGLRVSTEYTGLTSRYFEKLGIEADIRLSYGATEAKVPDIVDCIVEITETGRALRDRKSGESGKSVSGRLDLGGSRNIKKKNEKKQK